MDALITPDAVDERVLSALKNCPLFRALKPEQIPQLAKAGEIVRFETGEKIITQGEPSDSFFVIMEGDAAVTIDRNGEAVGLGSVPTPVSVGEVGLLLGEPRTATVIARSEVRALKFTARAFEAMFKKIPEFGVALSSGLAYRLHHVSDRQLPAHDARVRPTDEVLDLLPVELLQRHRILPLKVEGNQLTLGFVDEPTTQAMEAVRQLLPSLELRPLRIDVPFFNEVLRSRAGVKELRQKAAAAAAPAQAALGPARQAARADGGGRGFGPPPLGRPQAALARGRRHAAHRRRLSPRSGRGAGARDPRLREASPRGVRGGQRHRPRLRAARGGPFPRERLPRPPRGGRRPAPDPVEGPDLRPARPRPRAQDLLRDAQGPRARDRPHRQREVHDPRRHDRLHQQDRARPHHHPRGPHRVRAPEPGLARQPARGGRPHEELRPRPEGLPARGPRRRPRGRAARPRDHPARARDRQHRPPRLRHPAHQQRHQRGRPHDRPLPGRPAGPGPDRARGRAAGRGRPDPPAQERRRPDRRPRGPGREPRDLQPDPGRQDHPDPRPHAGQQGRRAWPS